MQKDDGFLLQIVKELSQKWQLEKCIRQFAQVAVRNAKFHSSQTELDQYTAASVILNEEAQEGIKLLV